MIILGIILIVLGLLLPAVKFLLFVGLLLALVGGVSMWLYSVGRSSRNYY